MFNRFFDRQAAELLDQVPRVLEEQHVLDGLAPEQSGTEPNAEPIPSGDVSFGKPDIDGLYLAAENGIRGDVVRTLLGEPISAVTVELDNLEEGHFGLFGVINFVTKENTVAAWNKISAALTKDALAQGRQTSERGGNLVVESPRGTRLVVGRGRGYLNDSQIHITTGEIRESYDTRIKVLPQPELTHDAMERAMTDVLGTIALSVNVAYDGVGKPRPNEVLEVSVPPDRYGKAKGEATQTPKDISNEFGMERPEISFDDIGGQDEAKHKIAGLAFAIANPELYTSWGTRPPKGVLLYGPPGTGKTLLAKALASEADAAFFQISATDITSKWYGEAEKRTKQIFDAAAAQERAIIYFDEGDVIMTNRDGAHEASKRVASVILQHMDGMNASENVMIVVSTNRKEDIDPAMLRPGRLDRWVEVGLPDVVGRKQTFEIHMAKATALAGQEVFAEDIDTQAMAEVADGHSGADIAEIIRRVLEQKVRQEGVTGIRPEPVSMAEILEELAQYERKTTIS